MQLFGLKEDIGLSLAPSQAPAFGVYGLSADDGRLFHQSPVRTFCQTLKTQGNLRALLRACSACKSDLPIGDALAKTAETAKTTL